MTRFADWRWMATCAILAQVPPPILFFCCGTMQHVAWHPRPRRGWYHCTLWCCGCCLASLLWSSGRPRPGCQAFSQHATVPGGSEHHGGALGDWQAAHSTRSDPTGDDIPCLPPKSTSFKGPISGGLGRSRPMDYILDEHDYNCWIGKPHELGFYLLVVWFAG